MKIIVLHDVESEAYIYIGLWFYVMQNYDFHEYFRKLAQEHNYYESFENMIWKLWLTFFAY